jgi:hypothetical protein
LDGQLQAFHGPRHGAGHLANVERHIAEGRASVLRQQEIIGRLESAGSRRSETASIAHAFYINGRRVEMHIATVIGFKTNCAKRPQFAMYRPGEACRSRLDETMGNAFQLSSRI